MNLILGLLLYLILLSAHVMAAPYQGKVFELRQPDGTTVQCKVYGDEFFQYVESLDGYTLIRNPQGGWIEYAQTNDDQTDFLPTGVVYHHQIATDPNHPAFAARSKNPHGNGQHRGYLAKSLRLQGSAVRQKAQQRKKELESINLPDSAGGLTGGESMEAAGDIQAASTTGSVVGLTILIDFSDQPAAISQTAINNYCNQIGYTGYSNSGSVRDYFYSVSNGLVEYTNYVTPYYRAANPKSYYEGDCSTWGKTAELILEALQWLDSPSGQNFDFRTLTRTTDNKIKCLNIFYAGSPACGWSKGLWPHSSTYTGFTSNEGVKSGKYQMTDIGSSLELGTFCHENGHMLCGYPDLYDYGGESNGVGNFCLMAYGGSSKNPVPPCSYLRSYAGWETVIGINNDLPGTLRQHTANTNLSYKYVNPANSKEYFMIESRLRTGRNASLPDEGLLIWHIDEAGSNDNQEMTAAKHYKVSVEQADGLFHLEKDNNYGGSNDCFHGGYKDVFDDYTSPSAVWWSGSYSGLKIVDIGPVSSTMSFSVGSKKLRANWKFNGTAQDSSGSSRHGTLLNGAGFGTGLEGTGSLQLDGVDDYMTVSGYKGIRGADSRTCAAWIRTDQVSGQILTWGTLATGQKWVVRVNDNGTLRAEVQNGSIYGTTLLTDNQWHHIAVVLSNDGSPDISEAKLYVDGTLETTGGVLACPVDTGTDQDVQVGIFSSSGLYFKGQIDEVRIYDYAMTAGEIFSLYDFSPKLLACWQFNSNTQDSSGNNRHGTLINGAGFGTGLEGTGSLQLDGVDDYMAVSGYKGVPGGNPRTCAAWIRTSYAPGQILTWGTNATGQKWVIRINENGTLRAEVQNGYIHGTTLLTDNQRHHIAVVLTDDGSPDISEAKLYVDGQLETIGGVLACPVDTGTDQNVQAGVFSSSGLYFKGQIDDVRVYNYALTAAEIMPLVDIFPPSPNPASFLVLPFVSGAGQITMTAATGLDSSAVQYFFEETTGHAGGDDSGWQSSTVYADADLQQGTEYRYRVKMKDAFNNETAFSGEVRLFIPPSADIIKDNVIDLLDLSALAAQWLQSNCYDAQLCQGADLNADNQVGTGDLTILISLWLQAPGSP